MFGSHFEDQAHARNQAIRTLFPGCILCRLTLAAVDTSLGVSRSRLCFWRVSFLGCAQGKAKGKDRPFGLPSLETPNGPGSLDV